MMEQCGQYWAITGRPAVDKHTLYDWTAVSYTTHTHTV